MKTLHNLINEIGARALTDEEKEDARMILNNLALCGYSDLWICIALIKILKNDSFNNYKYLLDYQPFIDEVNEEENKFNTISSTNKGIELSFVEDGNDDVLNDTDLEQIDLYSDMFNDNLYQDEIDDYLDYLYMRFVYMYDLVDCNLSIFKKLLYGTNEAGF